ncbi:hypothetical protein BH11PLA2_BH11PLA2_27450 [soil metagenome]
MSVEVQWTDTDPVTGAKRFVSVDRFAGKWRFRVRAKRRDDWKTKTALTLDLWESLLESLERRSQRREGVSDEDVAAVKRIISQWPQ